MTTPAPAPILAVVYGSAADPAALSPRDIDIAWRGDKAEIESLVRAWAAQRGLDEDLPIDWHPAVIVGSQLELPAPYGQHQPAVVLAGQTTIRWRDVRTLAAAVRALGGQPQELDAELQSQGFTRLAVLPATTEETRSDEWEYIVGLTALRSAVAKRPGSRQVLSALWPTLFPALLESDPVPPSPEARKILELHSPSGLGPGGVALQLEPGGGVYLPYARHLDAVALLGLGGEAPAPEDLKKMIAQSLA